MPQKKIENNKHFQGVLLFAKSYVSNHLLHLNEKNEILTENPRTILEMARCNPDTKPLRRAENHYEIIRSGLKIVQENLKSSTSGAGALGTSRSPRRKLFEKLEVMSSQLNETEKQMADDIYRYPLSYETEQILKRMLRKKISDKNILHLMMERHQNETLVNKKEAKRMDEPPQIVCSMGLKYKP